MRFISNDWYRWDALRKLGNSRLVQLTVLVPIVGYVILFNRELAHYYALIFDPASADAVHVSQRLYWLYFGFCFLAVASLLFNFFCPKLVKEYGSAAAFVAAEEYTTSARRLNGMIRELESRHAGQQPDEELRRAIANYNEGPGNQGKQYVMTEFFVPLKDASPRVRLTVFILYVVGFTCLGVPTVEVFFKVFRLLLSSLFGW